MICNESLQFSLLVTSCEPFPPLHTSASDFLWFQECLSTALCCAEAFAEVVVSFLTMTDFPPLCLPTVQVAVKQRLPLVLRDQHKTWCLQSMLMIILCCHTFIVAIDIILSLFGHWFMRIRGMLHQKHVSPYRQGDCLLRQSTLLPC